VGVEIRHPLSRLAVVGLVEALARTPSAIAFLGDMIHQIRRRRPALALLVDFPGLNLRLVSILRYFRIPILYYGAPQRWAWLGSRLSLLRQIDALAVTLPFEQAWFRQRGINATYVGHPLLDRVQPADRIAARRSLTRQEQETIIALLPGSREGEIRRHLPILRETLRAPDMQKATGVLAAVPHSPEAHLCRQLAPEFLQRETRLALAAADVALCASGTATLEVALSGVPAAVFYRLSPLSYELARRWVKVPWISLPNLVLQQPLLPELIQQAMEPEALARCVLQLLQPAERQRIGQGFRQVVERLGPPGVSQRVAALALKLLAL
jgi:lipid-A-disaccharide synthase